MIKKYIKHFIVISIMFLGFSCEISANVVINEVQIAPTEERFIELYNNGSSSIDLTDWYIQRKTATGSSFGSLISKTNFEGKSIEANSYFVVSKINISNSNIIYDGLTLTDSNAIQLKNNNGDVVDKVGWGDSVDCESVCAPNPVEGKSVVRNSDGSWIVASRTPGSINGGILNEEENVIITNNDDGASVANSSGDYSSSSKEESKIYKIATKIIAPKIVTANVPFIIDHFTTGTKNEKVILGKFVWNFGDGMKKEGNTSPPFPYVYQYPGDYVLTLAYYDSTFNTVPDVTDRLIVKVIPAGINISGIGKPTDPFIEIENNSNYEIALYKWIVKGMIHSFVIPEGMIILPNKKLKLSPKITGFDFNDLSSITIMDSSGQIFATYPNKIISTIKYSASKNTNKILPENIIKSDVVENNQIENKENTSEVINLNDLGASASSSDGLNKLNKGFYAWLGLAGIIVIGIVSVLLLRRKDEVPDYDDKIIKGKDMTIIE